MSFHADQAAMAARNIAKFGEEVTYVKVTRGAFDDDLGAALEGRESSAVTAQRSRVSTRDLGPGKARVEECTFTLLTADLPEGADRDDFVADSESLAWDIVDMPRRCQGALTDLVCQRAAKVGSGGTVMARHYEEMAGEVNGVNNAFAVQHTALGGEPAIFHDGMRMTPDLDYTYDAALRTAFFVPASIPQPGSGLVYADYWY